MYLKFDDVVDLYLCDTALVLRHKQTIIITKIDIFEKKLSFISLNPVLMGEKFGHRCYNDVTIKELNQVIKIWGWEDER